ncbi:MAG TPA: hypothetical protein VFT95_05775 [Micromonosporaceae bacterium]|nr:hypothetical protein [Micromonosporaceae bacterium]
MPAPQVHRYLDETRLHVQMPYSRGNRSWLRTALDVAIRPEWNAPARRWEVAKAHLFPLVDALAERFGRVDVFLEFSATERCDTRCRNATGDHCECSCLGEYHGGGLFLDGWVQVGETTLVSPGRLMRHMRVTRDE